MSESRTLKLTFLGDVSNLTNSLKTAENKTGDFGTQMEGIGKKVGLAMAAAAAAVGAYAVKLGIDGVKAAMEDEAAQERLATTLRNVTNATDTQIASVEEWITKTQLLYGISDSELRPALDRLVRATGSVGEAQKLTNLAMDAAAGTGKSVEAIANALGRAYEGNTTALGKLGLGIEKTELKTMSFDEIVKKLSDTFAGQASKQAETFEGKVRRLGEAWGEAKETVGSFIIDALQPLLDFAVNSLIPMLSDFGNAVGQYLKTPVEGVATFVMETLIPAWQDFWKFVTQALIPTLEKALKPALDRISESAQNVTEKLSDNTEGASKWEKALASVATFVTKILVPVFGFLADKALNPLMNRIDGFVNAIDVMFRSLTWGITHTVDLAILGINKLIEKWNNLPDWLRPGDKVKPIDPINWNDSGQANFGRPKGSGVTVPTVSTTTSSSNGGGGGSTTTSKTTATDPGLDRQTAVDAYNAVSLSSAMALVQASKTMDAIMEQINALKATPTTIVVQGTVVDPEGAARAIERVLYDSAARTGGDLAMVIV